MKTLKIDEIPEEGLELSWEEDQSSLMAYVKGLPQVDFDFETPLQSRVMVRKLEESVYMTGDVQTTLKLQCVRCLKEFSSPLSTSFELTLFPSKEAPQEEETELASEEMESNFFIEGEIHLSEIACEQIFLEVPYQPLCQEECKGLCPVCGKDRNLSSCECVKEEMDSGFAALKNLKLDK